MNLLLAFALPAVLILAGGAAFVYLWVKRPSPLALGSAFPKLCVVSSDEIRQYLKDNDQSTSGARHLRWKTSSQQSRVARRYAAQMAWNTKLFQQITRFEKLKIDPHKSSLEYETRETLTLQLVDESSQVRWFLMKAQASLALRSCAGARVHQRVLKRMLAEYKQLEQDFVALVAMASDDVYYTMLVDRLGLSHWRLLDGGSPEPAAS